MQSAHITTGSHFSQTFRLGYKLLLICIASGNPRPTIKWYKEGAELQPKPNAHVSLSIHPFPASNIIHLTTPFKYYEKPLGEHRLWSKLEIDPATMGDQGVYACVANNERGLMAKNFKAEYTY